MKKPKIINSFKYAIQGFFSALKTERNMKIHIALALIVIIMGAWLNISTIEWIVCVILIALVIAGELINTAIETVVDIAMPQKNEKAKKAKDISASAVLVLAIGSVVIGLIIFVPKILNL